MIRKFTLLAFSLLFLSQAYSQLAPNSFATDFTMTDIEGNEWNLYDVLNEGKSVVLDFSATWCGPCWSYHESHALENLYEQYGPDGTNEFMVFFIEADESTNLDCIYDLPGCNSSTYGDWTAGTKYPIIDNASMNDAYNIGYFPTIYHICPNRLVNEVGQEPAGTIYNLHSQCAKPVGDKNLNVVSYTSFSGEFCLSETFTPSVLVQNLGNTELSSASIELKINDVVSQTVDWTGTLPTYFTEDVVFEEVTVTEDSKIEINVLSVDGGSDEDVSDNRISTDLILGGEISDNYLTLELLTDEYAAETYWSIVDENENAIYTGGNQLVVNGPPVGMYENGTLYSFMLPLPKDGCYELRVYDAWGDGICCENGDGYYKLSDNAGNVLVEGSSFGSRDFRPFHLNGGTDVVNNATLVAYNDVSGPYCKEYVYTPELTIQNIGANEITSMLIRVSEDGTLLYDFPWTGSISSSSFGFLDLTEIALDKSAELQFEIINVNDEPDNNNFNHTATISLERKYAKTKNVELEIQLAEFGYEVYWQFLDPQGTILASGGNQLVADVVDEGVEVEASDPGAYADLQLFKETIALPADAMSGCYMLVLKDGHGDGYSSFQNESYVKISDENGQVIYNDNLQTEAFFVREHIMELETGLSSVNEITALSLLEIYPNPTSSDLNLELYLEENTTLNISVLDVVGKEVISIAQTSFVAGPNQVIQDVSYLESGIYLVNIKSDKGSISKKFTIIK